jgi:hypothetical protein
MPYWFMPASLHAFVFLSIFHGLALVACCCLAKAVLDFVTTKTPLHYITSPVLKVTSLITPAIIPNSLHLFLAIIWLLTARVALYLGAGAYGLLPAVTP